MWAIARRVRFKKGEIFSGAFSAQGDSPLGLDGGRGRRLILGPRKNWIGCFDENKGCLAWAAGPSARARGPLYIPADLKRPSWIAPRPEGGFLVCNAGRSSLGILDPDRGYREIADLRSLGMSSPANSVIDSFGNIWVNDIHRAALWVFTGSGKLLRTLGDPDSPMDTGSTPVKGARSSEEAIPPDPAGIEALPMQLHEARLSAIWDVKAGKDGLVYILEGSLLRIRVIDFQRGTISLVAGSGMHGYTGDGGDPRRAAFGRSGSSRWDGPLAFCTDDRGRLFIADTKNGVIRMIDDERRCITTIAGRRPGSGGITEIPAFNPKETLPFALRNQRGSSGPVLFDVRAEERRRRMDAGKVAGGDPLLLPLPSTFWLDWSGRGLSISDTNGDVTVIQESGGEHGEAEG